MIPHAPTGIRNGAPEFRPYLRGTAPAWARRVLAAAETQYGPPTPTCICGQPITLTPTGYARTCPCGRHTRYAP